MEDEFCQLYRMIWGSSANHSHTGQEDGIGVFQLNTRLQEEGEYISGRKNRSLFLMMPRLVYHSMMLHSDSSFKVCIPAEKHVEFQTSLEYVTMISQQ